MKPRGVWRGAATHDRRLGLGRVKGAMADKASAGATSDGHSRRLMLLQAGRDGVNGARMASLGFKDPEGQSHAKTRKCNDAAMVFGCALLWTVPVCRGFHVAV